MKRNLLIVFLFVLCAGSITASELNIYASGLRLHGATPAEQVTGENQVHIDYFLNAPATDLKFVLLDTDGNPLQEFTIPAETNSTDNYAKGAHSDVVVDLSSYYGNDATYKWAIKATAAANASFTKVFEHGTTLKRLFATIDNSPESDYMGRIYMENRVANADGKAYIINSDLTDNSNGLYEMTKLQSASRPSVDAEGYVWWADYGDSHGGLWVMNPATLKTTAFFNGTQASSGVWTNSSSVEMGSSSSGCHVYASGSSTKVYMVNEDQGTSLPKNGFVVYNVGQSNGSILRSWNSAPSQKVTVSNNGNGNFAIVGTSHGAFLCQNRTKDQNNSTARSLMFYDNDGTRRYNSTDVTYINGSNGSGVAVSKDETKLIMVNGTGNILLFDLSWSGNTPTLTYNTTYTTPDAIGSIGSLNFDYAGNILATGGTWDSSMKLYIFATPKSDNTCTTPAASSRTIVLGTYVPPTPVTGVTLNADSKTLIKGQSFTLTATVAPNDATNKNISWESSNSTVASVSNGVVTANAVGDATITVTTEDGSFTATCDITVELMHGTYNIGGASADFATLADACDALDGSGSISGDVTLQICADITETRNIGLTNNTDYTISIRPDGTTKRTITFSNADDNTGPSGNIMIGCTMATLVSENATAQWASADTKNIIIDGSYNSDNQQHLEIKGGNVGGVIVVFYGNVSDSEVRNCRLISTRTTNTAYGVHFRTQKSSDRRPSNIGLKNCYVQVTGANDTQAIYYNGSQSSTAAGKPKDCYVRGCEIVSNLRGIFFNGAQNPEIENNTICIKAKIGGMLSHGIIGTAATGTIIVRNNKFKELATNNTTVGAYGIRGITASAGATVWKIENNYFAGIDAKTASDKDFTLTYIRCGDSCEVRHNTFYMPALTNKPATAVASGNPITCLYLAGSSKYPVEHNIFVSAETEAHNSLIRGGLNANVKNNVYYHSGGNAVINAAAATKKTWEEFTAGGANAGSKWAEPIFADAESGDLALQVTDDDFEATRLATVLKDITGKDRSETTFAGAYEPTPVAVTAISMQQNDTAMAIGKTKPLSVTYTPANTTYRKLTWASDNACVTVSDAGLATAVSVGTAHVSASIGGQTASITIDVCNPVAHILPYSLRRTLNNDGLGYTFSFKSNIAATSGKLIFYQAGVKKGEVAIASAITAGVNEVEVAKTALPQVDGAMTWAVELTGADSKVIGELTDASRGIYNFYTPQGLAVDNSTESDYFGNIYIAQPVDGVSSGQYAGITNRAKTQKAGLFVYDPLLNETNPTSNQGYTLGLTLPAADRHGFKRVNVDEQGSVYVNSNAAIYKASPKDFTTSTAIGESKFTAINSFCVDEDVFYVMDNGTALKKLQSGTVTTLFTETSHLVSSSATDNTIIQDGRGGWWIAEGRANADTYYSLLHVNASNVMDFGINQNTNASILSDCNPKSTRGAMALNHDKTILALGSNSSVIFFDVAYDGAGKPTLTRKPWTLPTLGYNIDGLAFDYADNLYVVSASTERLYAFALPTATNTTLVPAKSTLTVDIEEHVAVTSISLSQTSASLEVGSTLDLTATCTPDNATDKTVEWQSDNTSVAEVNPTTGRVTAVSAGTAHITAVSTADEVESEQCTVTVYSLDFDVTWNTNGASYTTTLLSSNADLWTSFMSGYNAYYTAKGKSSRATQPMTAVATFAYHGVIDLFTDAASPWRWLGTYIYNTAREQSITLGTETEWINALQDFFSCTAVHVDFTSAGQTEAWLPLWIVANNYLPRTMRATDEMPTIRKGTDHFEGWYDNSDFEGSAVTSVTEDITLYAKWSSAIELDEQATTNSAVIEEAAAAGGACNVLLKRHFLVEDGMYTLVLPFDLDDAQLQEAFGAGYKLSVMQDAYYKSADVLYLKFGFVNHLEAGVPCLLQVGTDVTEDILFRDVTIDNSEPINDQGDVQMIGLYDMTEVAADVRNYYLGSGDYLFQYKTDIQTKGFRSYFHFPGFATSAPPRVARVIFHEEVATDDMLLESTPATAEPEKIIRDGEILIIVNGVEYDMMGRPRVK